MQATILVVDDTPNNIAILMEILRGDYRVLAAINGEQALKIVRADPPPDLILLDVMMPGMSGHEVCRRIRARPWGREIRIIALTGWGQEQDRRQTGEAGFDGHLVKPVDPATLNEVLASVDSERLEQAG